MCAIEKLSWPGCVPQKHLCVCDRCGLALYTELHKMVFWVQVCGSDQVWGQPAINLSKSTRPPTPRSHHTTTAAWLTITIHPTTPKRHRNTHTVTLSETLQLFRCILNSSGDSLRAQFNSFTTHRLNIAPLDCAGWRILQKSRSIKTTVVLLRFTGHVLWSCYDVLSIWIPLCVSEYHSVTHGAFFHWKYPQIGIKILNII